MDYCVAFSEQKEIEKAVGEILLQIDASRASFLIYFTDVDRFADITAELSKKFSNIPSIGASSYIVFTSKGYSKQGLGVLVFYNGIQTVSGLLEDISVFPLQYIQDVVECNSKLPSEGKTVCFELTTAYQNGEERIIDTLKRALGDDIEIFGGTAGNNGDNQTTCVAKDGKVYSSACVFVLINTLENSFLNKETIFKPTGSVFTVTDANPSQRIIYKINKLPAVEALSNACCLSKEQIPSYLSTHPIGHLIKDEQYIMEADSFNPDDSITFFAQVYKHSKIAIFEPDNIDSVFRNTKEYVQTQVPSPLFTIAINCLARTKYFQENDYWEKFIKTFSSYSGDFIGFSGYGEQFHTHHMNNTLVTATFGGRIQNPLGLDKTDEIDSLTKINNETGFIKNCQTLLEESFGDDYFVCVFNVNGFRVVNNTYGFSKGDELIQFIAKFLETSIKKVGVFAHIYADSFAFCVPYTIEVMDVIAKSRFIDCSEIDIPFRLTVRAGMCSLSTICQDMPTYSDIQLALDYAAIAQSKTPKTSENTFCFYNKQMHESMVTEIEITSVMRQALVNKEFHIYFQPQYNHRTGCLIGAEALCRWVKKDGSIVSPSVFIPIFEKNGFIRDFDRYIWQTTFEIIASWLEKGIEPLPISINISRISLRKDGLAQYFSHLSQSYGVDPKYIHLEFTESAYIANQEKIISTAIMLRKAGFAIAMDDFGSGYSSLNTLKDLPLDILKFDMVFVKDLTSPKSGVILAALIQMAQNLNLTTIVEGVESLEIADFLSSIGNDIIQGFLYSKPVPKEEYEKIMKSVRLEKIETPHFEKEIDINNFFNPLSVESKLFNDYVGPAVVFNWENKKIDIIRINNSYLSEIGLNGKEINEVKDDFMTQLTAESKKEYIAAIEETVKTKKMTVCISERKKDRKSEPIWIKSQFWCIASIGKRNVIYSLVDNVSKLKNAEQHSIEISNQMQTIIENSESGICLFSAKLKKVGFTIKPIYVNKRFYELTNFTQEQLFSYKTLDFVNIIAKEDRSKFLREVPALLLRDKKVEYVYHAWTNDGLKCLVNLKASVLPQGNKTYFVVMNFTRLGIEE